LAVLDELVDQLADGSFFGGVGPARLRRRRLEHQLLRLRPLLPPSLSSAPRPVLISRAKAKPTIAAPACATPGLLRTNSRVSSINSSASLAARLLAAPSMRSAALRA